jgi:hypothetical protein
MNDIKKGTVLRVLPNGRVILMVESGRIMVHRKGVKTLEGEEVYYHTDTLELVNVITYKADIWRRVTEDEAETLYNAIEALPIKDKMVFKEASYLDHFHEEFSLVENNMITLFGETRTAELLAPSE